MKFMVFSATMRWHKPRAGLTLVLGSGACSRFCWLDFWECSAWKIRKSSGTFYPAICCSRSPLPVSTFQPCLLQSICANPGAGFYIYWSLLLGEFVFLAPATLGENWFTVSGFLQRVSARRPGCNRKTYSRPLPAALLSKIRERFSKRCWCKRSLWRIRKGW